MIEIIEDDQRVTPGSARSGLIADGAVTIADVSADVSFDEASARDSRLPLAR